MNLFLAVYFLSIVSSPVVPISSSLLPASASSNQISNDLGLTRTNPSQVSLPSRWLSIHCLQHRKTTVDLRCEAIVLRAARHITEFPLNFPFQPHKTQPSTTTPSRRGACARIGRSPDQPSEVGNHLADPSARGFAGPGAWRSLSISHLGHSVPSSITFVGLGMLSHFRSASIGEPDSSTRPASPGLCAYARTITPIDSFFLQLTSPQTGHLADTDSL